MHDRPFFDASSPHNSVAARLVLLGLLAPIIGLGLILWFFLPGGVAGVTYTPSAYTQQVQLKPLAWQQRTVTVRGYLGWSCATPATTCPRTLWLNDTPLPPGARPTRIPAGVVLVWPQAESGWHAALRSILPGLTMPFPNGDTWGQRVSITGSLASAPGPSMPVALQPHTL